MEQCFCIENVTRFCLSFIYFENIYSCIFANCFSTKCYTCIHNKMDPMYTEIIFVLIAKARKQVSFFQLCLYNARTQTREKRKSKWVYTDHTVDITLPSPKSPVSATKSQQCRHFMSLSPGMHPACKNNFQLRLALSRCHLCPAQRQQSWNT